MHYSASRGKNDRPTGTTAALWRISLLYSLARKLWCAVPVTSWLFLVRSVDTLCRHLLEGVSWAVWLWCLESSGCLNIKNFAVAASESDSERGKVFVSVWHLVWVFRSLSIVFLRLQVNYALYTYRRVFVSGCLLRYFIVQLYYVGRLHDESCLACWPVCLHRWKYWFGVCLLILVTLCVTRIQVSQ